MLPFSGMSMAAEAYNPAQSYQAGQEVIFNGALYRAQWWANPNQSPVGITENSWDSPWVLISDDGSSPTEPELPPGEYPQYSENAKYMGGDIVYNDGSLYQCMIGVTAGWCSGAAWAYEPGKGTAWQQAWQKLEETLPVEPEPIPTPKPSHSTSYTPVYQKYLDGESLAFDFYINDWTSVGANYGAEIPKEFPDLKVFHVADFGAVPDDGQDDVKAIQAAIQAATENGGGLIRFDAGQYDLNINDNTPFVRENALWIEASNIVLQGAGRGEGGTTIKQWKKAEKHPDQELNRWDAVRTDHTINFDGTRWHSRNNWITQDIKAGDTFIAVKNNSTDFQVGDSVKIMMYSWQQPRPPISEDLYASEKIFLSPLYDDNNEILEVRNVEWPSYLPFTMVRNVAAVHSNGLELDRPIPRPLTLEMGFPGVSINARHTQNCGVRDLHIENVHDGSYVEGGYDTGGVQFRDVQNCWATDIRVSNSVLDISMNGAKDITVRDVILEGSRGHHGIGFYAAMNALAENIQFDKFVGHAVSFNGGATGNVARNIHNLNERGISVDFHSGFAAMNLVENITNGEIASSGGKSNNSASGQYNMLWNFTKNNYERDGLFSYCWYTSTAFNDVLELKGYRWCFRRHPKMFYVGLTPEWSEGPDVTINYNNEDVIDKWRYIEGLNGKPVYPRSLYEAQKHKGYDSYPVINGLETIELSVGSAFDPLHGVSVDSELYGDISQQLIVTGEVNTQVLGQQRIEYSVTDDMGLTTTQERIVVIK